MSSFSNANDPVQVSHRVGMHVPTTLKFPARKLLGAMHQLLYFLRRSCAETGDVAIKDQAERYQGHDVREKEVDRRPPENIPRIQECQRTKQETGQEPGEGPRL